MKRTLTQTAAILSIVIYSFTAIGYALTGLVGFLFLDLGAQVDAIIGGAIFSAMGNTIFFIAIPLLVISILQIVFSAKILKVISAPKQTFAKKFGIIITSVVISSIYAIFMIISIISAPIGAANIIELVALVLIIIFYIVDMAKNKNFVASENQSYTEKNAYIEQQPSNPVYSDSSVDLDRNYRPQQTQAPSFDLDAKLQRLASLRQQGMITQEEYEKLKQNAIEKELNK